MRYIIAIPLSSPIKYTWNVVTIVIADDTDETLASLRNLDDDGDKSVKMKKSSFARFARAIFILCTFRSHTGFQSRGGREHDEII